jgi:hypothetical protein
VVAHIGFCLFGETVVFGKTITMGVVFLIHEVNLLYWLLKKCLPFTQPSLSPKYFQNLDKKSIIDHTNTRMWLCESDKLKYIETLKN